MQLPTRLRAGLVIGLSVLAGQASAADLLLSDFNGTGFDSSYGGFNQQNGPSSARVFDLTNGWGGSVRGQSLDLNPLSDGRLVVDFTPNPGHGTDFFLIQLNDANGLSGRWTFNTGGLTPGQPAQLTSVNTIANPDAVYDGNAGAFVDTPPDLGQITNWAVEGQWASPEVFDISFDNLLISTDATPPPPYQGYEADAPWRAEAAARIEAHRMADLRVRVVDAAGNALPGASVSVLQQRHEFGFGSAVQARLLGDNPQANATYQAKAAELFNIATVENNFKWPAWEGNWGPAFSRATAGEALDWLESQGIESRGHVLVWPGADNLPNSLQSLINQSSLNATQQQQLRNAIAAHIADLGAFTAGRMSAWDAVNEPRVNNDVMRLLDEGDGAMATWFQQARDADPNARLFLNEFGILTSGGGTNTGNQRLLESQVRALIDAGAPIDGVGLQGHFDEGSLTGPEQLWAIVDRYADLGLDVQVTEFDFGTSDEQLQAAYLRDFFTAMFAHEGVDDLLMWGFWEDAHFDPQRALFRSDWSVKPSGQAYLDLVFGEWWTDETTAAGADGEAAVRAFRGEQSVTGSFGGESMTSEVILDADGETLTLQLAMLQGDYNRDGAVDAADYAVWRDSLGQEVAGPGYGADGDGDSVIGPGDLAVWRANFGLRVSPTQAVPEPSGWITLTLGHLLMQATRR